MKSFRLPRNRRSDAAQTPNYTARSDGAADRSMGTIWVPCVVKAPQKITTVTGTDRQVCEPHDTHAECGRHPAERRKKPSSSPQLADVFARHIAAVAPRSKETWRVTEFAGRFVRVVALRPRDCPPQCTAKSQRDLAQIELIESVEASLIRFATLPHRFTNDFLNRRGRDFSAGDLPPRQVQTVSNV